MTKCVNMGKHRRDETEIKIAVEKREWERERENVRMFLQVKEIAM